MKNSIISAYIQTAFWSSTDDKGDPLDSTYGPSDLAPATLARMTADCARFWEAQCEVIQSAIDTDQVKCGPDFDAYGRAGHDFWLTRNGHGAGFWDGDWPEPQAAYLTAAALAFGECDLYVGDDDKLYLA